MEQQVVIIIVIGLISLVNWVVKRSAEIREERKRERQRLGIPEGDPFHNTPHQEESPAPQPRPSDDSSPNMRRLMEALGLPPDDDELPPIPVVREAPPSLPDLPAFRPPAAPKPRFQYSDTRAAAIPPAAPVSPLSAALRSHAGIRQAVVLREILGPPKSLAV
jgi:hypothetical protein